MSNGLAQAVGIGVTVVPVFFLVFDTVIRLMQIGPVKDSFVQRGYPVDSAVTIGLLALVCIALHFVPGRSFLSRRERAATRAALPWNRTH